MYDNWSEIIEILKPVLGYNRSLTEIKIALEGCIRTLGWRTSNGSMKIDYKMDSGETIDIVLGGKIANGGFHAALPIVIFSEESVNDMLDKTTKIMAEINTRIAIVVGKSFNLFFFNTDTNKAIQVADVCLDLDNEAGIKVTSLLLARDFDESNLVAYFESLFKSKLLSMQLNAIINGLIADKTKAEEVLRKYFVFEGFDGELVDKALLNVGIDIFYKSNQSSEPDQKPKEDPRSQVVKEGRDNTRFSLNGGVFLSKKKFVHSVVAQYIKDNPRVTFDELETQFPSEITGKVRGVVRTLDQVKEWASQDGSDILTRYCTKENEILSLYNGTEVVVNNQWCSKNFPRFLAIAKKIYHVTSDAPYDGIEYSEIGDKEITNAAGNSRSKNFKFSMAGIKIGESIIFDPTQTSVKVASEDSIEYCGRIYRLTTFVRTYLPDEMRNHSGSYRGPDYFSYNGDTLTNLRNSHTNEESSPSEESKNDGINKGIQISLQSYNSFKTKK